MIRLTGGEWNGRKIKSPSGNATRPTSSRVREGVFNVLGKKIRECEFYDLYAGSGAIGFEALSRGAMRAIFLESAPHALVVLRENVKLLGCRDRALCLPHKLPGWLESNEFHPHPPAILFIDPPYGADHAQKMMEVLSHLPIEWGESESFVQTERNALMEDFYGAWRLKKCYKHGDTLLWRYLVGEEASG